MGRSDRKEVEQPPDHNTSSLSAFFKYRPRKDSNYLQQEERIPLSPEIPFQINLQNLQNLSLDGLSPLEEQQNLIGTTKHFLDYTDASNNLISAADKINRNKNCFTQKVNFQNLGKESVIGNIRVQKMDHVSGVTKEENSEAPSTFVLKTINSLQKQSVNSSVLSSHDDFHTRYRYGYVGKNFSHLRSRNSEDDLFNIPRLLSEPRQTFAETRLASSCSCKSSRCLKLYCECFKNNGHCGESCRCVNCLNQKNTPDAREAAIAKYVRKRIKTSTEEIPAEVLEKGVEEVFLVTNKTRDDLASCRCKVSSCTNRYCGCYSENQGCKSTCTCVNCLNTDKNWNKAR